MIVYMICTYYVCVCAVAGVASSRQPSPSLAIAGRAARRLLFGF